MTSLKAWSPEDRVITGAVVAILAGTGLAGLLSTPTLFGVTALAAFGLQIGGMIVTRSERLRWLLVYGGVAGILELWPEWLQVQHLHTVVYTDYFGFRLLASPSYMPIGWCVFVVQFGYVALRLREAWPPWVVVTVAMLGAVVLALWLEGSAASARTWRFTAPTMALPSMPLFVLLTYVGSTFAITTLALTHYRPRFWGGAVLAGFFASAGITFWSVFWFALLG